MAMIGVYADWDGMRGPKRIGFLHSRQTRTRELFEFQYDPLALTDPDLNRLQLDPEIHLFEGAQHPTHPRDKFSIFGDSSPDHWGRMGRRDGGSIVRLG